MSDLDLVLAAIRRRGKRIDELNEEYQPSTGHCCASCASAEFRQLVEKNERAAEWALRLISKTGLVRYGRAAQELRSDYPRAWRRFFSPGEPPRGSRAHVGSPFWADRI